MLKLKTFQTTFVYRMFQTTNILHLKTKAMVILKNISDKNWGSNNKLHGYM